MSAIRAVGSDHGIFWVGISYWVLHGSEMSPIGGLLAAAPTQSGAYILTKVHTGLVNVEVQYHDIRPELVLDSYEDSDMVVVDSPLGDLCVIPLDGNGGYFDEIVPRPGVYAVCCSANGRDDAKRDEIPEVPVEFYRFDIWPAAPEDKNASLKQTSAWGREVLKTFH